MSIWDRLQAVDRRWVYLVIWVVVALPLIFPFRIRPVTSPPVEKLFDHVDSMPEDKALVLSVDFTPDTQAELFPMLVALLRHGFADGRRVGVLAMQVQGLGLAEEALTQVAHEFNSRAKSHDDSVVNGEDYVFWGWTTPEVTVMLGMGERITNVFPVDYYGTKTAELSIMNHLRNYDDIGLLVSIAGSAIPLSWINYAQTQFGVRLACGITAVSAADFYPYLNSGQFVGMLSGMKGAAEYEELLDAKLLRRGTEWSLRRRATEAMSSQTTAHLAIMAFIVLGNIAFFITRAKRKP
uniref:Uncharacterized protein n=1 Tax=candidate division WOR-3 bacterium TaxID=2052148 RepID=A0A7C4CCX1_UNCW3